MTDTTVTRNLAAFSSVNYPRKIKNRNLSAQERDLKNLISRQGIIRDKLSQFKYRLWNGRAYSLYAELKAIEAEINNIEREN